MTGCIGDMQLDEEGAALFGVVGQQGCDGVTDTTTHLVPQTVALERIRQAQERCDIPIFVPCKTSRKAQVLSDILIKNKTNY